MPHVSAAGSDLDITNLNLSSLTASFVENGSGTSGQLIANDGTHHLDVIFVGLAVAPGYAGSATAIGFAFTPDGAAGTHVAWL